VAVVPQVSIGEAGRRELAATRDDVLGRCEELGLLEPVSNEAESLLSKYY
jgi:hypothetical protein